MTRYGLAALAARRILLHPARWTLLAFALMVITFLSATTGMTVLAIETTATRIIQAGPALVVSRVDAGGWTAIESHHAQTIRNIPGVASATPRTWGVLAGPPSVTVVADPNLPDASLRAAAGSALGVAPGDTLTLHGLDGSSVALEVVSTVDRRADIVAHDVVLVPADTARALLLLPPEKATDIAVESARDEENDALVPEIAAAVSEPLRVVTRAEMLGAYRVQSGQRATLAFLTLTPSVLALLLIVALTASGGASARSDVGKLKLMGWTSGEVARLHLTEMSLVASLAVGLGLTAAYAGLFLLGGVTVTTVLLGWSSNPHLALSTEGAALALLLTGASVLVPCLVAALVPAFRLARVDPIELTESP